MRSAYITWTDPTMFHRVLTEDDCKYYEKSKQKIVQMWQNETTEFQVRFCQSYKAAQCYLGLASSLDLAGPKWQLLIEEAFFTIEQNTAFDRMRCQELLDSISCIFSNVKKLSFADTMTMGVLEALFTHGGSFGKALKHCFGDPTYIDSPVQVFQMFPIFTQFLSAVITMYRRWSHACEVPSKESSGLMLPDDALTRYMEIPPRYEPLFRRRTGSRFPADFYQRHYNNEMDNGSARGPVGLMSWGSSRDPRFIDKENPLYAPHRNSPTTDWRTGLEVDAYARFLDYVLDPERLDWGRHLTGLAAYNECWGANEIHTVLDALATSMMTSGPLKSYAAIQRKLLAQWKQGPAWWPLISGVVSKASDTHPNETTLMKGLESTRWKHEIGRWFAAAHYMTYNGDGYCKTSIERMAAFLDECAWRAKKDKLMMVLTSADLKESITKNEKGLPSFRNGTNIKKMPYLVMRDLELAEWMPPKDDVKPVRDEAKPTKVEGKSAKKKEKKKKGGSKKPAIKTEKELFEHLRSREVCKTNIEQFCRDLPAGSDQSEDEKLFLIKERMKLHATKLGETIFGQAGKKTESVWTTISGMVESVFDAAFENFLTEESEEAKKTFPEMVAGKKHKRNTTAAANGEGDSEPSPRVKGSVKPRPQRLKGPVDRKLISPEEPLKACFHCKFKEGRPLEFKECGLCYDERVKDPRFYCCDDCQRYAWYLVHAMEHKEDALEKRSDSEESDGDTKSTSSRDSTQ